MQRLGRIEVLVFFLVVAFVTGGGLVLYPQLIAEHGMTAFIASMVFAALLTVVAVAQANVIADSGYFFVEYFEKRSQFRNAPIAALLLVLVVLSYYIENSVDPLIYALIPGDAVRRFVSLIIGLAIVWLVVSRARQRSFTIISLGLIVVMVLTIAVFLASFNLPENPTSRHMLGSRFLLLTPTIEMLADSFHEAFRILTLGYMFYLMIASFVPQRRVLMRVIPLGIIVSIILRVASMGAIINVLKMVPPDVVDSYATEGISGAYKLLDAVTNMAPGYFVLLVGLLVFIANLISIFVIAEIGVHIIEYRWKLTRSSAVNLLTIAVFLLALPSTSIAFASSIEWGLAVALHVVFLFEMLPALSSPKGYVRAISLLMAALVLIDGALVFLDAFRVAEIKALPVLVPLLALGIGLSKFKLPGEEA